MLVNYVSLSGQFFFSRLALERAGCFHFQVIDLLVFSLEQRRDHVSHLVFMTCSDCSLQMGVFYANIPANNRIIIPNKPIKKVLTAAIRL